MKTCLYRMNKEKPDKCRICTEDYNTNHHPNNLDCRQYTEVNLLIFEVQNKSLENKTK